jgi:hypothetical protein
MEDAFIQHLRIDNLRFRTAVRALLDDILENTQTIDFSFFHGNVLASAFYNPVNRDEHDLIASKLKTFVDDQTSILHFAMGMPFNSTRPVESIPGFDWDAVFATVRGLQTGSDQSYCMNKLSSTVLSQVGKRDFITSPRRDTVDSDLKHAVGAMLVLKTLKYALQAPLPGAGTPDDPIYYCQVFVDRVLRRFHAAEAYPVNPTTPTSTAPPSGAEIIGLSCFETGTYISAPKLYDNPAELRPHVEKIVHKIFFAAAQVLLTDRRFFPDPVQFHKWTQFVVLPMYKVPHHSLAAGPSTAPSAFLPPALKVTTTGATGATGASVGVGVTWDVTPSPRPNTATPSPRPRSITPSKTIAAAAAAAENF